jgi:hypothetical protein
MKKNDSISVVSAVSAFRSLAEDINVAIENDRTRRNRRKLNLRAVLVYTLRLRNCRNLLLSNDGSFLKFCKWRLYSDEFR